MSPKGRSPQCHIPSVLSTAGKGDLSYRVEFSQQEQPCGSLFPKSSAKPNDVQGCCSSCASRQVMAVQGWRGGCRSGSKPDGIPGLLHHSSTIFSQLTTYVKSTILGQGKGFLPLSATCDKWLGVWEAAITSLLAQVSGWWWSWEFPLLRGVQFSTPVAAAIASCLIHWNFFNESV